MLAVHTNYRYLPTLIKSWSFILPHLDKPIHRWKHYSGMTWDGVDDGDVTVERMIISVLTYYFLLTKVLLQQNFCMRRLLHVKSGNGLALPQSNCYVSRSRHPHFPRAKRPIPIQSYHIMLHIHPYPIIMAIKFNARQFLRCSCELHFAGYPASSYLTFPYCGNAIPFSVMAALIIAKESKATVLA
jgi:hypothetical protein